MRKPEKKFLSFTSKIQNITADWETVRLPDNAMFPHNNSIFSDRVNVSIGFTNGKVVNLKMESKKAQELVYRARLGDDFEVSIEPKKPKGKK